MLTVEQALKDGWSAEEAPRFVKWMLGASARVAAKTGLTLWDYPDWNWADSYEGGDTPWEAASLFMSEMVEKGVLCDE